MNEIGIVCPIYSGKNDEISFTSIIILKVLFILSLFLFKDMGKNWVSMLKQSS